MRSCQQESGDDGVLSFFLSFARFTFLYKDPFANPPRLIRPDEKRVVACVHPLGGCIMADSSDSGAVNHKGQVFNDNRTTDVYRNLYVCDGAIVPNSVGVCFVLAIAVLAIAFILVLLTDRL